MPLDADQQALAARVSNWGRWGAEDQRGTLNLLDEAATRRGAAAVRSGRSFPLAIGVGANGPQTGRIPGRTNPVHTMTAVSFAFTGDPGDFQTSDDKIETGTHTTTHWDALAHAGYDNLLFNGRSNAVVTEEDGATELGIDHFGPIVTRGLLCDVARRSEEHTS